MVDPYLDGDQYIKFEVNDDSDIDGESNTDTCIDFKWIDPPDVGVEFIQTAGTGVTKKLIGAGRGRRALAQVFLTGSGRSALQSQVEDWEDLQGGTGDVTGKTGNLAIDESNMNLFRVGPAEYDDYGTLVLELEFIK